MRISLGGAHIRDGLVAFFDGHPLNIGEHDSDQYYKIGDMFVVPRGKLQQALDDWEWWCKPEDLCDDEWLESEYDEWLERNAKNYDPNKEKA
jgi:hypothetical protein